MEAFFIYAIVFLVVCFILFAAGAEESPPRQDYRREIRRSRDEAMNQVKQTSDEFRQQVKKTMQRHRK